MDQANVPGRFLLAELDEGPASRFVVLLHVRLKREPPVHITTSHCHPHHKEDGDREHKVRRRRSLLKFLQSVFRHVASQECQNKGCERRVVGCGRASGLLFQLPGRPLNHQASTPQSSSMTRLKPDHLTKNTTHQTKTETVLWLPFVFWLCAV